MSIEWKRPGHCRPKMFFVKCPPKRLVYLPDPPDLFHVLRLHWVEESNGSYPCLGEGKCKLCDRETYDYAYTGCLCFGVNTGRWYPAILPVGDPTHTMCQEDHSGLMIYVDRAKDDTKRMIFLGTERNAPVPLPAFRPSIDVRPFLLRRWGLFKESDLAGCDLVVPTQEQVEASRVEGTIQERAG